MKLLLFTLFIGLLLGPIHAEEDCPSAAPTTVGEDLAVIETLMNSEGWQQERVTHCRNHEEEFRQFVLARLNQRIALWESNRANESVLEDIEEQVSHISAIMEEHYQVKANDWIASLSSQERPLALNCFVDYQEQSNPPYTFDFIQTVRRLRPKNNLEIRNICQGAEAMWQRYHFEHDQIPAEAQAFSESAYGRIIDQSFLESVNLSEEAMRRTTLAQVDQGLATMRATKEEIEGLSQTNLYRLYDFGELYENGFAESLSSRERSLYMPVCRDQSRWLSTCRPIFLEGVRDPSRCVSQTFEFAGEMIPGFSFVDGLLSMETTAGAYRGDLVTEGEYNSLQTDNVLQMVFGLPITIGATSVARGVSGSRRVTHHLVNFMGDQSGAVGRGFRRVFPIRNCENCTLRGLIIENDDAAHILPHRLSLLSAQRFLRPLEREMQEILESDLSHAQKIVDIEDLLMRRGTLNNQSIASPFRDRLTSLSPSDNSFRDLIQNLPRSSFRQMTDVGANGDVNYRVVHNGTTFRVSLCQRPTCRRGGQDINEAGRLLTIYPECGRGVMRIPDANTISRRIISSYESRGRLNASEVVGQLAEEVLTCR